MQATKQDISTGSSLSLPKLQAATVEGLSHQAIAVVLDLSVDAVKVRVHRARVRLNAIRAGMESNHVHHASRHS